MSRSFAKNNGKSCFAQIKKTLNASDYITTKKTKYSFFDKNEFCINYSIENECDINHTQLYVNLITKLDLSDDVIVATDLSGNTSPVIIDTTVEPYLTYNIDPCGNLFGNTICGITNFENYIVYNPPSNNNNPGFINNL
jgi:hypothetical protein